LQPIYTDRALERSQQRREHGRVAKRAMPCVALQAPALDQGVQVVARVLAEQRSRQAHRA
jgi:hypothetical protein